MKLLVIGGTYFLGRVFTMLAHGTHTLHLLHRGTYSMEAFGVKEHLADRHDSAAWEKLAGEKFDAVVDFCGYEPGDIRLVLSYLGGNIKRYVFVSTVDVCARTEGKGKASALKGEDALLETRAYPGDAGSYLANKVKLEQELRAGCEACGISCTIVRPSILYGPYNYAPREPEYIRQIVQKGRIFYPSDADGAFQMVYVKDAARMILALCGTKQAENEIYHLCGGEITGYGEFLEILREVADRPFQVEYLPSGQMLRQGMFLPFPVTAQETQLYDGKKVTAHTGISYTPLSAGMQKTYKAFAGVFGND